MFLKKVEEVIQFAQTMRGEDCEIQKLNYKLRRTFIRVFFFLSQVALQYLLNKICKEIVA